MPRVVGHGKPVGRRGELRVRVQENAVLLREDFDDVPRGHVVERGPEDHHFRDLANKRVVGRACGDGRRARLSDCADLPSAERYRSITSKTRADPGDAQPPRVTYPEGEKAGFVDALALAAPPTWKGIPFTLISTVPTPTDPSAHRVLGRRDAPSLGRKEDAGKEEDRQSGRRRRWSRPLSGPCTSGGGHRSRS